jgi:hypothetical protein
VASVAWIGVELWAAKMAGVRKVATETTWVTRSADIDGARVVDSTRHVSCAHRRGVESVGVVAQVIQRLERARSGIVARWVLVKAEWLRSCSERRWWLRGMLCVTFE